MDVAAVQAAVDGGGSVILRGMFNFGDSGRVLLRRDVDICGETDDSGELLTTVIGGDWSFFSPPPSPLPSSGPAVPGPKISVRKIRFTNALGTPIHLVYTSGVLIEGNHVSALRRRPFTDFFRRAGVIIGSRDALVNTAIIPNLTTGTITMVDNEIDVGGSDQTTTSGIGIFVTQTDGAEVYIARNFVTSCTRSCAEAIENSIGSSGNGNVVIENNALITSNLGIPRPARTTPNGIITGFGLVSARINDPAFVAPVLVSDNYVEAHGEVFDGSIGISALVAGATVKGNTVVMASATHIGFGIAIRGDGLAVLHNHISGDAGFAVRFVGGAATDPNRAINSVAVGNNISQFAASGADYLFQAGSENNTVVGNSGTVLDLGTGNRATGLSPVKGGVGEAVCDALSNCPFSD